MLFFVSIVSPCPFLTDTFRKKASMVGNLSGRKSTLPIFAINAGKIKNREMAGGRAFSNGIRHTFGGPRHFPVGGELHYPFPYPPRPGGTRSNLPL